MRRVACFLAIVVVCSIAGRGSRDLMVAVTAKPLPDGPDPAESLPVEPGGLGGRIGAARAKLVKDWGGTKQSEEAVALGLKWIAKQQDEDGRWKLDGPFPDKGVANDAAGTALALLPFLGCGKTHRAVKDEPYAAAIDKGLKYLVTSQTPDGAFSKDNYAHGLATIAICEAYALTKDAELRKPAQLAIDYIVAGQHNAGGWRYSPGQAGDTSVTGWTVMALKTGVLGGLDVPAKTFKKAQNYFDGVLDQTTEGYGYIGPQPTPTMTAVSLLCRQYLQGWGSQNQRLIDGIDNYVKPNSPKTARKDIYQYYYSTQVMHHFGGTDWKAWNEKMRDLLVGTQDKAEANSTTYGSWSPQGDTWGRTGGRLMQTSLSILTLEVYYRHVSLATKKE